MRNRNKFSLDTPLHEIEGSQEKRELKTKIEAWSEASVDHPARNEDAIFQLPEKNAAGVFDGVSGADRGELASVLARDYVANELDKLPNTISVFELEQKMAEILHGADQVVQQEAKRLQVVAQTTVATVKEVMENGQRWAVIGHAGDSRVYKIRTDGKIEQLTLDDGITRFILNIDQEKNEAKKFKKIELARKIQEKCNQAKSMKDLAKTKPVLAKEEREKIETINRRSGAQGVEKRSDLELLFGRRNIINNGLGMPDGVKPRITTVQLGEGESLLLATDGLFDNVSSDQIEQRLKKGGARELVTLAKTASIDDKNWLAKRDDISVAIMKSR